MVGVLRKRKKEPTALSAATARTAITVTVELSDEEVRRFSVAQAGVEIELEATIRAGNAGGPVGKAYVELEYDELGIEDRSLRLVRVKVVEPAGLPRYLPVGAKIKLRGMITVWTEANPPPFEGPAFPA